MKSLAGVKLWFAITLLLSLSSFMTLPTINAQGEVGINITVIQGNLAHPYAFTNVTLLIENVGSEIITIHGISLFSGKGIEVNVPEKTLNLPLDPHTNVSIVFGVKASLEVVKKDCAEEDLLLNINISYIRGYGEDVELQFLTRNVTIDVIKLLIEIKPMNGLSLNLTIRSFDRNKTIKLNEVYVNDQPISNSLIRIDPQSLTSFKIDVEDLVRRSDKIEVRVSGDCEGKSFNISRTYSLRSEVVTLKYEHTFPYTIFIHEDLTGAQLYSDTLYYDFYMGRTRAFVLIQELFIPSYRYVILGFKRLLVHDESVIIYQEGKEYIGPILGGLGLLPFSVIAAIGFKKVITKGRKTPERESLRIPPPDHIDVG